MPEYGFSLTLVFPYKDRIYDSVLIPENMGQRKSVLRHILPSECLFVGIIYQQKLTAGILDTK